MITKSTQVVVFQEGGVASATKFRYRYQLYLNSVEILEINKTFLVLLGVETVQCLEKKFNTTQINMVHLPKVTNFMDMKWILSEGVDPPGITGP